MATSVSAASRRPRPTPTQLGNLQSSLSTSPRGRHGAAPYPTRPAAMKDDSGAEIRTGLPLTTLIAPAFGPSSSRWDSHSAEQQTSPPPRDYIHFDPSARRGPSGPPMDGSSLGITLLPGFQPSHGDHTSPLYTTATASAPRQSRPSARAGTGHVLKPPPARRDC
jgi:hypothetical protein